MGSRVQGFGLRVDVFSDEQGGHRLEKRAGADAFHSRANVAHTRQSRPDSGIDFEAEALNTF